MNFNQKLNRQGENECNNSPKETERPTDNKIKSFNKKKKKKSVQELGSKHNIGFR